MSCQDLAFVADALLSICEQDRAAPFYRDEDFARLLRSERPEPLYEEMVAATGPDELVRQECAWILQRARLTPRQERVLRQRLQGATFEMIGRGLGGSKQYAQQVFSQVVKKIWRARNVYRYAGLAEVYRSEIRRGSST